MRSRLQKRKENEDARERNSCSISVRQRLPSTVTSDKRKTRLSRLTQTCSTCYTSLIMSSEEEGVPGKEYKNRTVEVSPPFTLTVSSVMNGTAADEPFLSIKLNRKISRQINVTLNDVKNRIDSSLDHIDSFLTSIDSFLSSIKTIFIIGLVFFVCFLVIKVIHLFIPVTWNPRRPTEPTNDIHLQHVRHPDPLTPCVNTSCDREFFKVCGLSAAAVAAFSIAAEGSTWRERWSLKRES